MGHFEKQVESYHVEFRGEHRFSICSSCTETIVGRSNVCRQCGYNPVTGNHVPLWALSPNQVLAEEPAILTYSEIRTEDRCLKVEDVFWGEIRRPWILPFVVSVVLISTAMAMLAAENVSSWMLWSTSLGVTLFTSLAGVCWFRYRTYSIRLYTFTCEEVQLQGERQVILGFWRQLNEVLAIRANGAG